MKARYRCRASWSVMMLLLAMSVFSAAAEPPAGAQAGRQAVTFLDLQTSLDGSWQSATPTSSMRLAQYAQQDGGLTAELIVYYFGPRQGGSAEANIARWRAQFRASDGGEVQPQVVSSEVAGMPLTRVKLQGSYARAIGIGNGGPGKPDQTLLAALLGTPRGQVTIQLHGDSALVASLEPDFDRMLAQIRPAGTN